MKEINLITPPDKLYNHNFSILLINPSDDLRNELQHILKNSKQHFDIYMYEVNTDNHDYKWLLDVHKMVDICILELERMPTDIKTIESYLISFGNTHFFTQSENILYNKISGNRLYTLNQINDLIRG